MCGTIAIRQYRRRALPRQRRLFLGDRVSLRHSAFASVPVVGLIPRQTLRDLLEGLACLAFQVRSEGLLFRVRAIEEEESVPAPGAGNLSQSTTVVR